MNRRAWPIHRAPAMTRAPASTPSTVPVVALDSYQMVTMGTRSVATSMARIGTRYARPGCPGGGYRRSRTQSHFVPVVAGRQEIAPSRAKERAVLVGTRRPPLDPPKPVGTHSDSDGRAPARELTILQRSVMARQENYPFGNVLMADFPCLAPDLSHASYRADGERMASGRDAYCQAPVGTVRHLLLLYGNRAAGRASTIRD